MPYVEMVQRSIDGAEVQGGIVHNVNSDVNSDVNSVFMMQLGNTFGCNITFNVCIHAQPYCVSIANKYRFVYQCTKHGCACFFYLFELEFLGNRN